jgi:hypothetical protein
MREEVAIWLKEVQLEQLSQVLDGLGVDCLEDWE